MSIFRRWFPASQKSPVNKSVGSQLNASSDNMPGQLSEIYGQYYAGTMPGIINQPMQY